jgi:hypothetical protein
LATLIYLPDGVLIPQVYFVTQITPFPKLSKTEQRTDMSLQDSSDMYVDRVYRLQLEFCEISQMLARAQKYEDRRELTQRRMEIVAEASELVYTFDTTVPVQHIPAHSSSLLGAIGISSE